MMYNFGNYSLEVIPVQVGRRSNADNEYSQVEASARLCLVLLTVAIYNNINARSSNRFLKSLTPSPLPCLIKFVSI